MGDLPLLIPKGMHKDNAYVLPQEVGERSMVKFWGHG